MGHFLQFVTAGRFTGQNLNVYTFNNGKHIFNIAVSKNRMIKKHDHNNKNYSFIHLLSELQFKNNLSAKVSFRIVKGFKHDIFQKFVFSRICVDSLLILGFH